MGNRVAWQVLRVRPRFEHIAAAHLSHKGFEVFLPFRRTGQPGSDRRNGTGNVLFPGYMFCRMSSTGRNTVLTVPGVLHLVGTGSLENCCADETEVGALKIIVNSSRRYQPCPFLSSGPKIRISDGPLRNLEGILINPKKRPRIAVSVSMLERSVLVDLPVDTGFEFLPGKRVPPMRVPA